MKWSKPILNMVLPTILFYLVYKRIDIITAVFVSAGYIAISMTIDMIDKRKIQNSQVIGLVGLIGSAAAIMATGNAKFYYLPALIENGVFLVFIIVLTIRKKSVLHYLAKDFEVKSLEQIPEDRMFSINMVWGVYFLLKIISKTAGLLFLDFDKMYWLVFILGDPMTIVVVIISIIIIRKQFTITYIDENRMNNEGAGDVSAPEVTEAISSGK